MHVRHAEIVKTSSTKFLCHHFLVSKFLTIFFGKSSARVKKLMNLENLQKKIHEQNAPSFSLR